MSAERMSLRQSDQQDFTRRYSFTEKSKRRLEFFRRRSLQAIPDHGRSLLSRIFFSRTFESVSKVRSLLSSLIEKRFVQIQMRSNVEHVRRGKGRNQFVLVY